MTGDVRSEIILAVELLRQWKATGYTRAKIEEMSYSCLYSRRITVPPKSVTSAIDFRFAAWVVGTLSFEDRVEILKTNLALGIGSETIYHGVPIRPSEPSAKEIVLSVPDISFSRSPGFIVSSYPLSNKVTRVYCALRPRDVPWFFGVLRRRLREEGCDVSMKVCASPQSFDRADVGVIYLDRSNRERGIEVVVSEASKGGRAMRNLVPLGTAKVAAGVAWADGFEVFNTAAPSFGQWLVRTLVAYLFSGRTDYRTLETYFEADGRSLEAPYLAR